MTAMGVTLAVLAFFAFLGVLTLRRFVYICAPNMVLIFSGRRYRARDRTIGYRVIKGGRGFRLPMLERVDHLDLTNMVIDVSARDAYSKGGIPLSVQGMANVKVAGHEPVLHNAVERFLEKPRAEIVKIAKATLEGSLRGILATMTPEEVNEDRNLFAERLVQEVEHDMTALGLVVDTLKIQHVSDQVSYLDSIGRRKNAEVIRAARIAEAMARAEARINAAQNREREAKARIQAETDVARAEAERRLTATLSQREALTAEEQATVAAQVAQARAGLDVQKARVEQVRHQLEAEIMAPARAALQAAEAGAKAGAAPIVADGRARADALRILARSWQGAGPRAREMFLLQKLDQVVEAMSDAIAPTEVEEVTMIDARSAGMGPEATLPVQALATVETLRQVFGLGGRAEPAPAPRSTPPVARPAPAPEPEHGPLDFVPDDLPRPAPQAPPHRKGKK
jgi:flotillin